PVALPDIDTLWPLCLAIAQRRRDGVAPRPLPTRPGAAVHAIDWLEGVGHVLCGDWSAPATQLFDVFKPLLDVAARNGTQCIGQLGQSLDGCVATAGGDSAFVNGPEVLAHLHRLRALSDAVIVGAGTAALDNPRLTTRRVAGPNPVRVVIDPTLRVPAIAHLFTDDDAPTLLVCNAARHSQAAARFGAARVLGVPCDSAGALDLGVMKQMLAMRGLHVLFVEGGGVTVSRFIAQRQLDRLHLSIAPVVIGGGRAGLQLTPSQTMRQALRPPARLFAMGDDALWDLDLRQGQQIAMTDDQG
ncbi:MAG: RibD family protein, partial [Burkholderiaceae bacterium]